MDDEKLERDAAKVLFSTPAQAEEIPTAEPHGPEIPFVCPFCNEAYNISSELAGKKIKCRNCHEPSRVDSPKRKAEQHVGASSLLGFWPGLGLGVVIGISLTILAVSVLKVMRLL